MRDEMALEPTNVGAPQRSTSHSLTQRSLSLPLTRSSATCGAVFPFGPELGTYFQLCRRRTHEDRDRQLVTLSRKSPCCRWAWCQSHRHLALLSKPQPHPAAITLRDVVRQRIPRASGQARRPLCTPGMRHTQANGPCSAVARRSIVVRSRGNRRGCPTSAASTASTTRSSAAGPAVTTRMLGGPSKSLAARALAR